MLIQPDVAGALVITGAATAGATCTVTFNKPYPANTYPVVTLSPLNLAAAQAIGPGVFVSSDHTWFIIHFVGTSGAQPRFNYNVVCPVPE